MLIDNYIDNLAQKKVIVATEDINVEKYKSCLHSGVVGANRITDKKHNLRIIQNADIYTHIDNIPFTYSDYSKLLVYKVMDIHNVKKFRNIKNEQLSVQGLYASVGSYPAHCYVDIKDNHFTIYKNFLFSQYQRSRRILTDAQKTYFYDLEVPKTCKRYIYGIMRATTFTQYKIQNNNVIYSIIKRYHILHNRDVVNLINDLSQAICWYAINIFNGVYCNTDGFIIPFDKVEAFINFLAELGFVAKVKGCGFADIKAIGVYQVGDLKTLHYDKLTCKRNYINLSYDKEFYNWLILVFKNALKRGGVI
jgi:hypothetical protein